MSESLNGFMCAKGEEFIVMFQLIATKRWIFQYDYREKGGELFSTIGGTVEECRQKRVEWEAKRAKAGVA